MTITGPAGVPTPTVTEDIGTTVSVNTDSRRRVGSVAVPVGGDYTIRTQGQVGGFISPRLAFGRTSPYGFLVWVFAGVFGGALLTLIGAARWSARRPRVVPSETAPTTEATYTPDAEGVRLAQLKTIAALRDSGALTDAEFRAEKRRILKGR